MSRRPVRVQMSASVTASLDHIQKAIYDGLAQLLAAVAWFIICVVCEEHQLKHSHYETDLRLNTVVESQHRSNIQRHFILHSD